MTEESNKVGSAETCSSAAGSQPMMFSAAGEDELKRILIHIPAERRQLVEHRIRVLVNKEVLAQKKLLTGMGRNIEDEICSSEPRSLELRFSHNICSPVCTGEEIKGEGCVSLKVAIVDSLTGEEVKSGPEASAKVQIVVLKGDSDCAEGNKWTHEEFEKRIVTDWQGRKSLLVGNGCLNLVQGIGLVPRISFTSNSRWMKHSRFRLGARVVDISNGIRVNEAKTNAFDLKDRRGKLHRKRDTPSLFDEVWRLRKIGRKGPVVKKLGEANIKTVKDFFDLHFLNPKRLQEIFGGSAKNLEDAVTHARTCPDKMMWYPQLKTGVVFKVSGEVLGLVSDGQFVCSNMLSETEKGFADKSVISAFEHWGDVVPFDDQKYLAFCSSHLFDASHPSNSSPTADVHELPPVRPKQPSDSSVAGKPMINEYSSRSDEILVFNELLSDTPYQGLDYPIWESISMQGMGAIFSSIDSDLELVHRNQQNAAAPRAAKAQGSWGLLMCLLRLFMLRKKCLKHVHKKPRLSE